LVSNQHTALEHVEGNLKTVLMGAGYTSGDAELLPPDSPFLRLFTDSQNTYIGLHMHLLNIALRHGWTHTKSELSYHVKKKLKEIQALYQSRLQVIVHNYCYLRDLQTQKWQTFGIQDLQIRELQASLGVLLGSPPVTAAAPSTLPPTSGSVHHCNHCKTSLHPGNKASCATEARRDWSTALRRLGEGADPIEDDE
jgi:hypothetical protein